MSGIINRIKRIIGITLIASVLLCSCTTNAGAVLSPIYALNTAFSRTVFEGNAQEADKNTAEILHNADLVFNRFNPQSELYKLNNQNSLLASEDLLKVLSLCKELEQKSDGAFSCTMGDITDSWDFNEGKIPEENLDCGILTLEGNTAYISGGKIDLGAVAKGYVIDKILEEYKNAEVKKAVISCGSSVGIIGDGTVGIRNPDGNAGEIIGKFTVCDKSISTSGDYEKFFIKDGVRYHHILDPKTKMPAQTSLRAVTVIGQNGALADALSTAAFVLGYEKGRTLLEEYGYDYIFITEEKEIFTTLQITLTDEAYELRKN